MIQTVSSECISVFDIFKIGIGPSSSHTMGPWKACKRFVETLSEKDLLSKVFAVSVDLYGSLALTGKGHGTDLAVVLGLSGYDPTTIPQDQVRSKVDEIKDSSLLMLNRKRQISFDVTQQLKFNFQESLDYHPNGMIITASDKSGNMLSKETYFSVGGGFIVQEGEVVSFDGSGFPFPIDTAADLKRICRDNKKSIGEVVLANECSRQDETVIRRRILEIWEVMSDAVYHGCSNEGFLPGPLRVSRRAPAMWKKIIKEGELYSSKSAWLEILKNINPSFDNILKLVSCFAIATNEENANFRRVVTAPTNGAAGVIPAVLLYFVYFNNRVQVGDDEIVRFLCVASEIGSLFKKKSTISAAMGGCQAEIGVSSAMAAAALTDGLGGTMDQTLMAAEIAMEHHLGLTCDPVKGLVQIPCIERNSMGAVKAITASEIALSSDPELAKVTLDEVIKTMWETACDMDVKYKETSKAGLAANIAVSIPEC